MHSAEGEGGSVAYKGMVDCFARTVKEEGWQALFKVLVWLSRRALRAAFDVDVFCIQRLIPSFVACSTIQHVA